MRGRSGRAWRPGFSLEGEVLAVWKLEVWVWGNDRGAPQYSQGGKMGSDLHACPAQPCGGEQSRPRAGTQNPTGLSSAQLSRHSRPLLIGYFCCGMCQPLGFSWRTGVQVTPSPHSAPPSVSGCVWGWAGKAPVGVQGPLAGSDMDTRVPSPHTSPCMSMCNICPPGVWETGPPAHTQNV